MSRKKSGRTLDQYLTDSQFNRDLYSKLKAFKRIYWVTVEDFEVSFFDEFYAVLALVQANLDRPELFSDRIRKNEWVNLMTDALIDYAEGDTSFQNSAAMTVIREIKGDHEYDVQDEDDTIMWSSGNTPRKLANYERRLAGLPTSEGRLAYLLRLHTKVLTYYKTARNVNEQAAVADIKTWLQLRIAEEKQVAELARATSTDTNDEYDPAKRGLTRQLAMLLMDELFPNLANASKKAKAEFLAFLVGWDSDGLRQKWSDYQRGNPASLAVDQKTVETWKRKLGIKD